MNFCGETFYNQTSSFISTLHTGWNRLKFRQCLYFPEVKEDIKKLLKTICQS